MRFLLFLVLASCTIDVDLGPPPDAAVTDGAAAIDASRADGADLGDDAGPDAGPSADAALREPSPR